MEKMLLTKNGVSVYSYQNKGIHSFCIGLYVKGGCLYEDDERNGITHFFEHISFKNLNNTIGMELSDYLDMHSLDINGCTYKEFVQFKISGASKNFKKAADVIAAVLSPVNVTKNDIECERKRIKAEIRESSERTSLDYFTNNIVWAKTPLKNTICGKMSNLDRINLKELSEFQKEFFSSDNFFFYVTGNFSQSDIDYLSECILKYHISEGVPKKKNAALIPCDFCNRKNNIHIKNSDYTYLRFSFDVNISEHSPEVLDLLFDVLFYGEKSVIYKELSDDKGFIYSFDWAFEQYANAGVLYFEFEVRKNKLYDAVKSVVNVLNSLEKKCGERLKFVKPKFTDNALLICDHCENFNWERAYECHILDIPYKSLEDKAKLYEKAGEEELKQSCKRIFRVKNLTLSLKAKKKTINVEKLEEIIRLLPR